MKLAEKQPKVVRTKKKQVCEHDYIVETPHGRTSKGVCRKCGTTRRFPTCVQDILLPGKTMGYRAYAGDNTLSF